MNIRLSLLIAIALVVGFVLVGESVATAAGHIAAGFSSLRGLS